MFDRSPSRQTQPDQKRTTAIRQQMQAKPSPQHSSDSTRLPLYTRMWGNQVPPGLHLAAPVQMQPEEGQQQEYGKLDQHQANTTGLPDTLKAGVENLSGLSMDDVRVHYNSSSPAQVQALAYTQGVDIHMGPGQERHLPHEAWHVVQQKQGRVQPTIQAKGVAINDDVGLEKEADVMGERANREGNAGASIAAQRRRDGIRTLPVPMYVQRSTAPVQRFFTYEGQDIEDIGKFREINKIAAYLAEYDPETWLNHRDDFDLKMREPGKVYSLNAWLQSHGYNMTAAGILLHLDAQRSWNVRKKVINQVTAGQWLVTIEAGTDMPSPQIKKDLLNYIMSVPVDMGWKFFNAYFSNADSRRIIWSVLVGDDWEPEYQAFVQRGSMLGLLKQAFTNFVADRTLPDPVERKNLLRYRAKLQDEEAETFQKFLQSQPDYISTQFYYFFQEADRALDVGDVVRLLNAFSQEKRRPRQELLNTVGMRIVALGAERVLDQIHRRGDFSVLSKVLESIFPPEHPFWGEHEKSRIKYQRINLVIQAVRDFKAGKGLGDQESIRKAYRECKQEERENIASVFGYDNYWTIYSIVTFRDIAEVASNADLLVTLLQAIFGSKASHEVINYALKVLGGVTPVVFKKVLEATQTRGGDLRDLFGIQAGHLEKQILLMPVEVLVPAVGFSGVSEVKVRDHYKRANDALVKQYNIMISMPSYTQVPVDREKDLLGGTGGAIKASVMKVQGAFILDIITAYRTPGRITSFWFSSIVQDRTGKDAETALLGQAFSENAALRFKGNEAVFVDINAVYLTFAHELGHILAGLSQHHEHVKGLHGKEETGDIRNLMFYSMKGGGELTPEQLQAFKSSVFAVLQKK